MQAIVTPDGLFRLGGKTLRCALGRGGARADKREGDGATPVGDLPLRRVLYRADRGPALGFGCAEIDDRLADRGLATGALH